MDYEFWFWVLVAFLAGLTVGGGVYIGSDEEKYNNAATGILLPKRN